MKTFHQCTTEYHNMTSNVSNAAKNKMAIEAVIKAASRIRALEDEVGRKILPFLTDMALVEQIASKSGVKSQYLLECAAYSVGIKRRNKTPYRVRSRGAA